MISLQFHLGLRANSSSFSFVYTREGEKEHVPSYHIISVTINYVPHPYKSVMSDIRSRPLFLDHERSRCMRCTTCSMRQCSFFAISVITRTRRHCSSARLKLSVDANTRRLIVSSRRDTHVLQSASSHASLIRGSKLILSSTTTAAAYPFLRLMSFPVIGNFLFSLRICQNEWTAAHTQ